MIYIFSESNDILTDTVISKLRKLNQLLVRFDLNEYYIGFDFDLKQIYERGLRIYYNNFEYVITEKDSVWFRRGNISSYLFFCNNNHAEFKEYIISEKKALESFVIKFLKQYCYCLGNPLLFEHSKLEMLSIAMSCKLCIPESYVTYTKRSLIDQSYFNFVSKPLSDCLFLKMENEIYYTYIEQYNINDVPDFFGNSMFQRIVNSNIELRVLCIEDKMYCSQINKYNFKHIDMRHQCNKNYEYTKYKLPLKIINKIRKFTKKIDCNFMIFDILLDDHGEYYFIDFNPCGQYDEIRSLYSNEIDREIALTLINESK